MCAKKSKMFSPFFEDENEVGLELSIQDPTGRDEMNLSEFPISLLGKRPAKDINQVEFKDTIETKDGRIVERHWEIVGSAKYGLPTETDEQVYIALMEITQEQGFLNQSVHFTRYDLIKRMNWRGDGYSFKRIERALDRLMGVTIKSENAFYDKTKKSYVTKSFHIIESYSIHRRGSRQVDEDGNAKTSFKWSDFLWNSFKSGYIKLLDTDRYFRLETSVARRLYRYLDKKFGKKSAFSIDIFLLGHEHLGITRKRKYRSQLKQCLVPAIEELVRDGYIESYSFRPSKTNRRSEIVEFIKSFEDLEAQEQRGKPIEDPVAYFYKRLLGTETLARQISIRERREANKFCDAYGDDVWRDFVKYALAYKEKHWPEMATLSGALSSCLDTFLKEQEEEFRRNQQRKREEEKERVEEEALRRWYEYLEEEKERIQISFSDRLDSFNQSLEKDPGYRSLCWEAQFDLGEGMALVSQKRRDRYYYQLFAYYFRDEVMGFNEWKKRNRISGPQGHSNAF